MPAASPGGTFDADTLDANTLSYQQIRGKVCDGVELTYTNRFDDARVVMEEARALAEKRAQEFPREPDLQALAVLFGSYVSFMAGVSALRDNQKDEMLKSLDSVKTLVEQGPDWAGKPLVKASALFVRGTLLFGAGFVSKSIKQCGQAVWSMLSALGQLRGGTVLKDATLYVGRESEILRPFAVYTSACTNLAVSELPPAVVSTTSWLLSLKGERNTALVELETLWREDGIFSAPAAAMLLTQLLDDSNTGKDFAPELSSLVPQLLSWSTERYSRSFIFISCAALHLARKRDVEAAYKVQEETVELVGDEFPGVKMVNYRVLAKYAMTLLRWEIAGDHCRTALRTQKTAGRRAGAPDHAATAALCYAMAGKAAEATEMLNAAREYKKENKKDWHAPDKEAFEIADSAPEDVVGWRPVVPVMMKLVLYWQCAQAMDEGTASKCIAILDEFTDTASEKAVDRLLANALIVDAHRQLGNVEKVLEQSAIALARLAGMNYKGNAGGAVPLLYFNKAWANAEQSNIAGAKDALNKYQAFGKDFPQHGFLSSRVEKLKARVGAATETRCAELAVPARKARAALWRVPGGEGLPEEVRWDVLLTSHDINVSAHFQPEGGAWAELEREDRWEASSGPWAGSFKPAGPGTLKLEFDNTFSKLRSKTLLYQVEPQLEESAAS